MFVTLPLTIAWLMLGFAQSFPVVCLGFALCGFSFGLKVISNSSVITLFFEIILKYYKISKEAPSLTYVSEISEPEARGTLLTIATFSSNFASFLVLALGSFLFSWRQVSFICAVCPLACLIAVSFVSSIQSSICHIQNLNRCIVHSIFIKSICLQVPESPYWLLSKDRTKDAQKSLQW